MGEEVVLTAIDHGRDCSCGFSPYGFLRAVCARKGSGKHSQPFECEIQESGGTNCALRLFMQKSAWVGVLADLA